ncbi:MAG: hypothetical protein LUG24_03740 [Clostridiales bacterium]|nr:hypothetical protein [Clostridiales bacterium]
MGADTNYSYTKNMRTLFKSSISRLKSFYCREDAERALKRVRSAPEDAVIFRTEELKKICSERDIDVKELIKNKELLEKFPTQAEMQEELLEIFYGLYKEFKNPSDYMERIVRRLAPEYKDDTVRTVILKKFVIGGGFKWKAVKTNVVCDWVINRMSSYEKEHFEGLDEESRLEMIVDGINDEIFSEENLSGELNPAETIGLMVKRIKSLRDNYETADKDNRPVKVSDFKVREETRAALKAYCGEKGIYCEPNDKIIDILERVTAAEGFDDSGAKGFFDILKDDFAKQMRTTFYGSKLKKASELYKNDKKDALTKKQAGWKLLQICDDLTKGSFKNNLGKTRVYIYYFAFMFGMTAAIRETDIRDDKTDIEKNLFEDYYCDNLVRFFESTYKDSEYLSSFEKEPAGNGINYKNFMEVIYLYYLYRTDLNLKPGQKIDRAEKKIRECIKKAEKANKESGKDKENTASDDIFSGLTSVFKRMYINSIADIDEDEIADFVSETI